MCGDVEVPLIFTSIVLMGRTVWSLCMSAHIIYIYIIMYIQCLFYIVIYDISIVVYDMLFQIFLLHMLFVFNLLYTKLCVIIYYTVHFGYYMLI